MDGPQRLELARAVLREGHGPSRLAEAIAIVARARDKSDLALIVPHTSSLEPVVVAAALEATRAYGREAIALLDALPAGAVDVTVRRKLREQLLRDFVVACCQRDRAINPFQLDYPSRTDEILSLGLDLEPLLLGMLRESASDLRKDLNGTFMNRRYYYNPTMDSAEPSFLEYGALAVCALWRMRPELLKREMELLVERDSPPSYGYYGWGQVRQPATRELACLLCQAGVPGPALKMVSDMESMLRYQQDPAFVAGVYLDIASVMMASGVKDRPNNAAFTLPQGPFEAAQIMDHVETAIALVGQSSLAQASYAHYLRARLLAAQGDDGGALRELEQSLESSDEPLLIMEMDVAFASLKDERRFKRLLDYIALISRRIGESERPYKAASR